jgi:type IV pilus assembly protein PilB
MIGEIRDLETAEAAVRASLTGHLVFSTVHTNDAPIAITRMIDIGVEPYLLATTIEAVIAQRLVRRICSSCRTEYAPSPELLMELQLTPDDVEGKPFAYGKGCTACGFTGYKGRTAIFEMMVVNERIRQMIIDEASIDDVRVAAREDGMRSLRESGLLAIFDGTTTIEEVVRETVLGT